MSVVLGLMLGLVIVAVLVFVIGKSSSNFTNYFTCEKHAGVCSSSGVCGEGYEESGVFSLRLGSRGCAENEICCIPIDGSSNGGSGSTSTAQPSTLQLAMNSLQPASIKMNYIKEAGGGPIMDGQSVVVLTDDERTLNYTFTTTVDFIDATTCEKEKKRVSDVNAKRKAGEPVIEANIVCIGNWYTRVTMATDKGQVIKIWNIYEPRDDPKFIGPLQPYTSAAEAFSVIPSSPSPEREKPPIVRTVSREFLINLSDTYFRGVTGQKFKVTIDKYLVGVSMPNLERRTTFTLTVVPPFRTTTVNPRFEKEKKVEAVCDPIKCAGVYFEIKDTPTCKAPKAFDSTWKELTTKPVWEITDGTKALPETYPDKGRCDEAKVRIMTGSQESTALNSIFTNLKRPMTDVEASPFLTSFGGIEKKYSGYTCQVKETTLAIDSQLNKVYRAESFDMPTQKGTIRLNQQYMNDKYLCVYTQDQSNKDRFYSDNKPQKLMIDRLPPYVEIDFNFMTLSINFLCIDLPEGNNSGCKEQFGYSYIKNVANFLPALFSGPQSAEKWCPPMMTPGAYTSQTKTEVAYNSNEVRVLCMRGEDKAGNAAITMRTVYNGYATLAAAIAAEGETW